MILLFSACVHGAAPGPTEPLPVAPFEAAAAAAAARVPDPARGGPPIHPGASPLPPFLGVSRATARYVGEASCAGCHPSAASAWSGTKHASALTTLTGARAAANPDCLPCHVTGFGQSGGWSGAASAVLAHVGCESCHGPGSDHVAAPAEGYGALPANASACVACHTHDTAPDFDYGRAWSVIAHGAEPG